MSPGASTCLATPTAPDTAVSGLRDLTTDIRAGRRHERGEGVGISPWPFFALTYLLSWAIWTPLVLSHFEIGPLVIPEGSIALLRLLGVLVPAMAAIVLVARRGGRSLVRAMLARLGLWRLGWRWWVAATFAQPAILLVCAVGYGLLGGEPSISSLGIASMAELIVTLVFLGIAVLGEEIGWRGLALPALQTRMTPLRASLVLGVLWGAWHLPFWLLLDTYTQFGVGYLVLDLLLAVPMTVFITWFFNHTGGSLLVVAAYHLAFNVVNTAWLPVTSYLGPFVAFVALEWLLALAVMPNLGVPPRVAPMPTGPKEELP